MIYLLLNVPHLSMPHQSSLRSIIRISISPRKSQRRIPRISRTRIPRAQRRDRRLRRNTSVLPGLRSTTHIRQLIADPIGDDAGVERLLLAFVDDGVDGLEGVLGGLAAVEAGFEFHGWGAGSEVEAEGGDLLAGVDADGGRGAGAGGGGGCGGGGGGGGC